MPVRSSPFPWTRRSFLSAAAASAGVAGLTPAAHATPAPFQPTWDSLVEGYRTPDWFRDAKFGIWAHWGAQSVPEIGDWYARRMYIQGDWQYDHHVRTYGHPSKFGFMEIQNLWKAENWNPDSAVAPGAIDSVHAVGSGDSLAFSARAAGWRSSCPRAWPARRPWRSRSAERPYDESHQRPTRRPSVRRTWPTPAPGLTTPPTTSPRVPA
jgi:hypothetical protein